MQPRPAADGAAPSAAREQQRVDEDQGRKKGGELAGMLRVALSNGLHRILSGSALHDAAQLPVIHFFQIFTEISELH